MQEEFENKVRERMHTFGIQPSRQVWDDIDAVLSKQKHRRVFVGWWILLGLVVMGGFVFLYEKGNISRDTLNQQPPIVTDSTNNRNLTNSTQLIINDSSAPVIAGDKSKGQPGYAAASTSVANNVAKNANNNNNRSAKIMAGGKGTFSFNNRSAAVTTNAAVPAHNNAAGGKSEVASSEVAKNTTENITQPYPQSAAKQAASALLHAGEDTADKPITTVPDSTSAPSVPNKAIAQQTPPSPNIKTIEQKKQEWFLTISAGTTQTVSFGSFNSQATLGNVSAPGAYSGNIPAITSLNVYNYNIAAPGTGFHASAGLEYDRQLSTRWKIYGGISIGYITNTQQTGTYYKGNSSFSTGNSVTTSFNITNGNGQTVTLSAFYGPGNQASVANKAWQAEIPVGLRYVVNPTGKTKFMLNGGLSFDWIYSSQWLIPDARYNKLYYSKTVFNNTAFNWQVGPSIELPNHWKFGMQYHQSFTTVAKNYVVPKLYWQNISIYTAIPLGRRQKHRAGGGKSLF